MPTPYFDIESPLVDRQSGKASRTFGLLLQFWHRLFRGSPQTCFVQWGTGSPESVITAPVGSVFLRTNGGASTTLYVKESGSGATGWVGK